MSEHRFSISEVLGTAIRAQADAAELYAELALRVRNPFLRQRVMLLAREELQHQRMLEESYKQQFPDRPLALPSSQLPKTISSKSNRDQLSVKDILWHAIEQERRCRGFYFEAAERTADMAGKRLFSFLADWEHSHQMALNGEYEMLVRYPHYFEQDPETWRPQSLL